MTERQIKFLRQMTEEAEDHHRWLEIMDFASPVIGGAQSVLLQMIYAEAERQLERKKTGGESRESRIGFEAYLILEELKLCLQPMK